MIDHQEKFELYDVRVRRLRNGNKLRLTFEIPYNLDTEKRIIDLRGENIKLKMVDIEGQTILEDQIFEIFDIKVRKLSSNDRLSFILENMYDKKVEMRVIEKRFDDVSLLMETIDKSLFDELEEEEEEEDPEEN
jgi:hypothetical protein